MASQTYEKASKSIGIGVEHIVIVIRKCFRNIIGIGSSHCESGSEIYIIIIILSGENVQDKKELWE
jgi:hypothetical protein